MIQEAAALWLEVSLEDEGKEGGQNG